MSGDLLGVPSLGFPDQPANVPLPSVNHRLVGAESGNVTSQGRFTFWFKFSFNRIHKQRPRDDGVLQIVGEPTQDRGDI